jgi:penicillin-binding protein 2
MATVNSYDFNWAAVQYGMHEVLNSPWTANYPFWVDCRWTCAGKTGTAQKGEGITNDGIFICYGPYRDPEIAICIVVERGGAGANTQFMAREIMDVYINIRSYSDSSEAEMALLR